MHNLHQVMFDYISFLTTGHLLFIFAKNNRCVLNKGHLLQLIYGHV